MRGALVLFFWLVGCVGDSTVNPNDAGMDADPTGTKGHVCFPNNTCLGTLTCQLPADICVDLGSDASSDAPVGSDAGDAGDAAEAGCTLPGPPFTDYAAACFPNSPACIDCATGNVACNSTCASNAQQMKCGSSKECGGGACCLDPSVTASSTCPINLFVAACPLGAGSLTSCPGSCNGGFQLCSLDSECTGGAHCRNAVLSIGGFKNTVGVCAP